MIHTEAVCKLFTALYRKASDCAALLHFHSSYSLKFKEAIVFFPQVLGYNLLIADDTLLQKELDSLTISLFFRQYPLEIITYNTSKALLYSTDTLLDEPPGHQVPDQSSQLWPHTQWGIDASPSQYELHKCTSLCLFQANGSMKWVF